MPYIVGVIAIGEVRSGSFKNLNEKILQFGSVVKNDKENGLTEKTYLLHLIKRCFPPLLVIGEDTISHLYETYAKRPNIRLDIEALKTG